jgi:hypothetical protein
MMKRKMLVVPLLLMLLSLASFGSANAQTRFGVRGGIYLDQDDPFVGAHFVHKIQRHWVFNPNFEYVLLDRERASLFTINADIHYDLPSSSRSSTTFWLGGGLGISHFSLEEAKNTDTGLNLLMGASFGRRGAIPFLQIKVMVEDESQLVLGGGITF